MSKIETNFNQILQKSEIRKLLLFPCLENSAFNLTIHITSSQNFPLIHLAVDI